MGGREEKEEQKGCGGENEEELGGIGLFGPVVRISNFEEKAQPARQQSRNLKIWDEMMSKVGTTFCGGVCKGKGGHLKEPSQGSHSNVNSILIIKLALVKAGNKVISIFYIHFLLETHITTITVKYNIGALFVKIAIFCKYYGLNMFKGILATINQPF